MAAQVLTLGGNPLKMFSDIRKSFPLLIAGTKSNQSHVGNINALRELAALRVTLTLWILPKHCSFSCFCLFLVDIFCLHLYCCCLYALRFRCCQYY